MELGHSSDYVGVRQLYCEPKRLLSTNSLTNLIYFYHFYPRFVQQNMTKKKHKKKVNKKYVRNTLGIILPKFIHNEINFCANCKHIEAVFVPGIIISMLKPVPKKGESGVLGTLARVE